MDLKCALAPPGRGARAPGNVQARGLNPARHLISSTQPGHAMFPAVVCLLDRGMTKKVSQAGKPEIVRVEEKTWFSARFRQNSIYLPEAAERWAPVVPVAGNVP
jgi:hypothetical protein